MHLKILSLGDEYASSAGRYLAKIAKCDDVDIVSGNLILADSSLADHVAAIESDNGIYRFEFNDEGSIRTNVYDDFIFSKALDWFDWDYITVQQGTPLAGVADSYFPHISTVAGSIRQHCPGADIVINEPWAFETDCTSAHFASYNNNTVLMAQKIRESVIEAAQRAGIKIVLPVGEVWSDARKADFCRLTSDDGCHASRCGEFLASAVWYEILTGNDVSKNKYRLPFVSAEITARLKEVAHDTAVRYKL